MACEMVLMSFVAIETFAWDLGGVYQSVDGAFTVVLPIGHEDVFLAFLFVFT
uniref:Uncharacterized protein n=1 Tax=Helianthus annuus TaxID=4232 RepID=A0A251TPD3_HELAN